MIMVDDMMVDDVMVDDMMMDDVRMICITSTVISIAILPHISAYFSVLQPYFSLPLSVAPLTQCIFSLDLICYVSYIIIMICII